MSELENYDQDRLFKNFFFKYRFHLITSILVIALLVIVGRNLYLKTNTANTTSLYNFNKIISDFAIDSASENLYSDLKEFKDNSEYSKYFYYISSMLSYIDFEGSNFEMIVPLQKQNILKNDNAIFKDISKINLAVVYIELDEYENALNTLDNVSTDELKMLAFDIKGNIFK